MSARLPSHSKSFITKEHMDRSFMFLLWLIKQKKMHGYEIIKKLRGGGMAMATPARIYPLLAKLCEQKLISQVKEMHGKRERKIYAITREGQVFYEHGRKVFFSGLMGQFVKDMVKGRCKEVK